MITALFNVITVMFGVIKLQNPETGHYLAFNKKGHLYGEVCLRQVIY